jgi:hypothetical protein
MLGGLLKPQHGTFCGGVANIVNKQSWTADEELISSMGGWAWENSSLETITLLQSAKSLRLRWIIWIDYLSSRKLSRDLVHGSLYKAGSLTKVAKELSKLDLLGAQEVRWYRTSRLIDIGSTRGQMVQN